MLRYGLVFAAMALACAAGCVSSIGDVAAVGNSGSWKVRKGLPPPPVLPDTVIVQQRRLERPEGDADLQDRLWRAADDHFLGAELKAELARHGLRAAKLPDPPPPELLALLAAPEGSASPASQGTSNRMLAGQPFKIEMTPVIPEHTLFECVDGALRGERLRQVQGYLVATPALGSGNRVRLAVEPRLEAGEAQPKPLANLNGLDWKFDREGRDFPALALRAELASGEYLIVGPLPEAATTLGGLLFRRAAATQTTWGVLLIRVLRPTADEQFHAGLPDDGFQGTAARLRTPAAAAARGE